MKSCGYQQKSALGGCDERRPVTMDSVVCPKPRRLGLLNSSLHDQIRPFRLPFNHQIEVGDSRVGPEMLDMILTKGSYGGEKSGYHVASSPPFYCGSPPSRASNPVIQDVQFVNDKMSPAAPPSPSSSSARIGGGCVRTKFGHKPATVRVEGFDCLCRDRQNCSISAVA